MPETLQVFFYKSILSNLYLSMYPFSDYYSKRFQEQKSSKNKYLVNIQQLCIEANPSSRVGRRSQGQVLEGKDVKRKESG